MAGCPRILWAHEHLRRSTWTKQPDLWPFYPKSKGPSNVPRRIGRDQNGPT